MVKTPGKLTHVVLDFDGTFTDVEREGEPFTRAYQEYFADLLGKDEDLVRDVWRTAERRVREEPHRFGGFEEQGKVVAPPCDPYLRASAVARIICQRFQVLRNPQLRNDIQQTVFRLAYRQTATSFRPDAGVVLDALLERRDLRVSIVTNAAPAQVLQKLSKLDLKHRTDTNPGVFGDAYKFGLSGSAPEPVSVLSASQTRALPAWAERYAGVPDEQRHSGLSRAIHPRRGHYFRVLRDQVWRDDLGAPERTLVCGDIFELDLALPAALGCWVHLVTREGTPPHETSITSSLERGAVSADLSGLLERLPG